MGVTASGGNTNDPAALVSPSFPEAYATCTLKFWHTLMGTGSTLNVDLFINRERFITIYRRDSDSTTATWSLASIKLGITFILFLSLIVSLYNRLCFANAINFSSVGSLFTNFEIVFSSYRTFSSFGHVTIDDVSLEDCQKPLNNATSCASGEFRCNRGSCVSMDRICDSVDDCGDSSDEVLPICSSYRKYFSLLFFLLNLIIIIFL